MWWKAHQETEVQYLYDGQSYRKNSNAFKFVLTYQFIHKNFRLIRGPVFVLRMVISKKFLFRQISFDLLVNLHIKFSRWSGVRFSVRFPVFVLLMVVSMDFLYTKISFVLLIFFSEFIVLKRIFRLVFNSLASYTMELLRKKS